MAEIRAEYRADVRVYRYEHIIGGRVARVDIPYPTGQRPTRRERDRLARAAFAKLARSVA